MKISREPAQFRIITVELENEKEVVLLYNIMAYILDSSTLIEPIFKYICESGGLVPVGLSPDSIRNFAKKLYSDIYFIFGK